MIKKHTINTFARGETQAHIEICTKHCPTPNTFCNGECEFYKQEARRLRQTKQTKKSVVIY